ncbi:MAG: ApbE family lipoprotein [Polaromonas sp.]|nr:ApbE family lipoprotein [Polaromonas sp.]
MKRRNFLRSGLGAGAAGLAASGWFGAGAAANAVRGAGALQWRDRTLLGFGTVLTLRVAHADDRQAERALDAAVDTIRHVEDQMSLFRTDSALSRLNREGVLLRPHPDLVKVLQLAQGVSARSQGAFDVTVQPLWTAFEQAAGRKALPSPEAVTAARAAVGWQHLSVSGDAIRLARPGMGVTLNGIAQGFAADLVRTRLQALGVNHALVNAGEWTALGRPDTERPWLLGLQDPRDAQALIARLALDGRSIAVSADNECSFSADRVHHHIFDPRTGYSPAELACVAVAAPSCALADALTKVMFAAGSERALRLAREWKVDVLVVDKQGKWQATAGLKLHAG